MPIPRFLWLILIPLLSSPLVYFGGRIAERRRRKSPAQILSLLALLPAGVICVDAAYGQGHSQNPQLLLGAIRLEADGVGMLLSAIVLVLGTLAVLFSASYVAEEAAQEKYYALLLAMIGVMVGLGFSSDLFNLWIWFEGIAITSYLLVSFYREQPASLEAGIKYLVQSACGSALILWGIALVLMTSGNLSLDSLGPGQGFSRSTQIAIGLFIAGFGVKASLVPLHTWLPDAHSQAPSGISAMLSGVVIEAGLIALLRVLAALAGQQDHLGVVLMGIGALNMLVGNLMALGQREIKRLLAYSSVAQIGYMILGVGLTIYSRSPEGAQGGFFHLVNHGLMKGLAFLAAGSFLYALHLRRGRHQPLTIEDLSGASRRFPVHSLALSIGVLGLGGLPPFAGFMSKWQIFAAGFQTHDAMPIVFVGFAALNSVLSLAYYAPIVNALYRQSPSPDMQQTPPMPATMTIPIMLLAAGVLIIGLWPSIMNWLTQPASAALMAALQR